MYIMSDILQEVLEEHFQQDPSPTDEETLQISEHPQSEHELSIRQCSGHWGMVENSSLQVFPVVLHCSG